MAESAEPSDAMSPVVQCILAYKEQSEKSRETRLQLNRQNFDCYHMRQDWSHKQKGQSKEFLAKQSVAVEQLVSFLQQGLVDKGDWFSVETEPGVVEKVITARDIFKILRRQMEKNKYYTMTGDALKTAALSSLLIAKEDGKYVPKITYRTKFGFSFRKGLHKQLLQDKRMVWQSRTSLVRFEDYYPDPSGANLYELQEIELDLHTLKAEAEHDPDYDKAAIADLEASYDTEKRNDKSMETGQDEPTGEGFRKRVTVLECWGTIIDSNGNVLHENCVATVANGRYLIKPPKPNPFWHQESPFVVSAILRVPFSTVHRALMDAPTMHNRALNEVYNLMLDAGLQSTFGIRQIREGWLEDPSQIADGIPAGTTLRVNNMCPPGQKVMERIDTSTENAQQALMIFNITDKEFNTSAFTNDIRMGALPDRAVKATEIVSTNQVLAGVTSGIVKTIEDDWMSELLRKKWVTCAQHLNDYSDDEMKALLGEEKAMQLANMSPEDIFAETAQGMRFKVFGLSTTLNKIQDFRHIGMLLQLISASPDLMSAFAQKYDLTKLLGEIVTSLDIDVDKIKRDGVPDQVPAPQLPTLQAVMGQMGQPGMMGQPQIPANPSGMGPGTKTPQNIPQPGSASAGPQAPRRAILQGITHPGGANG